MITELIVLNARGLGHEVLDLHGLLRGGGGVVQRVGRAFQEPIIGVFSMKDHHLSGVKYTSPAFM